ncbi:MAG: nitroreductase family protein [Bdellovibrionales bacterium]|nr:nitroreductase family protein [Bdellovibrionales bacterium]
MADRIDPLSVRKADHEISDIFLKRWSPRAMSGEAVSQEELLRLFEAARWAPSSYNEQEWRFLYAHRDTSEWQRFFDLLVEMNQAWCKNAAVLILVVSKKTMTQNGKPNLVHSLDTGMAVQNLMLQAVTMENVVTHGMAGFDRDAARRELGVPEDFDIECMIAVGRPGSPSDLPEALRDKEQPSLRRPIDAIAREGRFTF